MQIVISPFMLTRHGLYRLRWHQWDRIWEWRKPKVRDFSDHHEPALDDSPADLKALFHEDHARKDPD